MMAAALILYMSGILVVAIGLGCWIADGDIKLGTDDPRIEVVWVGVRALVWPVFVPVGVGIALWKVVDAVRAYVRWSLSRRVKPAELPMARLVETR